MVSIFFKITDKQENKIHFKFDNVLTVKLWGKVCNQNSIVYALSLKEKPTAGIDKVAAK